MKNCPVCDIPFNTKAKHCSRKCHTLYIRSNGLKIDKKTLHKLYNVENKTIKEISRLYNCIPQTIRRLLIENNISIKPLFKDYTGQIINGVKILKRVEILSGKRKTFAWVCECGICKKEFNVYRDCIDRKKTIGCRKCSYREISKRIEYKNYMFNKNKFRAIKEGYEFNISKEYVWDLFLKQNRKCKLTDMEIGFAESCDLHNKGLTTASLDRIDSSKGYVEGNVQWVHKWINIMKCDFEQEEFIEYCRKVAKKNPA